MIGVTSGVLCMTQRGQDSWKGSWWDLVWIGTGRLELMMYMWTGTQSYVSRASDLFLQCKKHCILYSRVGTQAWMIYSQQGWWWSIHTMHISNQSSTWLNTNISYPITTLADCKSSDLVYQLLCTKCNAFYIRKTDLMLLKYVNGHRFTCMIMNSNLLITTHIKSH